MQVMLRWRVGFEEWTPDHPRYSRLLHRRYAHCWATRRLWRDCWLWVEWRSSRLVLGLASTEQVRRACLRTSEVWTVTTNCFGEREVRLPIVAVHHCGALVAHALGLHVPFATPYRLACALARRGGRRLIRPECEVSHG